MIWLDEGDGRWTAMVPGRVYTVTGSSGRWYYTWETVPPSDKALSAGHLEDSRELAQAAAEAHWLR